MSRVGIVTPVDPVKPLLESCPKTQKRLNCAKTLAEPITAALIRAVRGRICQTRGGCGDGSRTKSSRSSTCMLLQHLHALIFAPASDLLSESNSSICSQLETKSRGGSVAPPSMRPDSPPPTNHDDDDGRRDGSRTQQASAAVRVNGRVRAGGPVQRGLVNMRTKEAQRRRRRRRWWQRRTGGPTVNYNTHTSTAARHYHLLCADLATSSSSSSTAGHQCPLLVPAAKTLFLFLRG